MIDQPSQLADDLLAGKLCQRCPSPGCPVIEAAGSYSTCHEIPTGPADWYRQERGRPASVAHKAPRNALKGGVERQSARTPTLPDIGAAVAKETPRTANQAEAVTLGL